MDTWWRCLLMVGLRRREGAARMAGARGAEFGAAARGDSERNQTKRAGSGVEHSAARTGSGFDSGDAVARTPRRPSVGTEPAGQREPGGSAQNQPAGDGSGRSAGVCDAEL